jgi:uncharacterized cupredoxin-like copper-binding protein
MRGRTILVRGAFVAAALFIAPFARAHDPHSHAHLTFSAGEPGDPKLPSRTIEVAMGRKVPKMYFRPDRIEVHRGEQIRFVLKNADNAKSHEFVLATAKENLEHAEAMKAHPNMEHNEPNAKRLRSKETKELLWRFTKVGEFEFSCNLPGHREAGMVGKIVVK